MLLALTVRHGGDHRLLARRADRLRGGRAGDRRAAAGRTALRWRRTPPRHHVRRRFGNADRRLRHRDQGDDQHRCGQRCRRTRCSRRGSCWPSRWPIISFYSVARGLQVGEAVPVITVIGVAASLVQIVGGIVVFGDPMPTRRPRHRRPERRLRADLRCRRAGPGADARRSSPQTA